MVKCNQAEQRTKQRVKAIALITLLNGLACKDLKPQSLVDNFVALTKYVWKHDKDARNDAIEFGICKLTD